MPAELPYKVTRQHSHDGNKNFSAAHKSSMNRQEADRHQGRETLKVPKKFLKYLLSIEAHNIILA